MPPVEACAARTRVNGVTDLVGARGGESAVTGHRPQTGRVRDLLPSNGWVRVTLSPHRLPIVCHGNRRQIRVRRLTKFERRSTGLHSGRSGLPKAVPPAFCGLTLKALRLASHDSRGDLNSFAPFRREGLEPKKSSPVPELRNRQSRSFAVT